MEMRERNIYLPLNLCKLSDFKAVEIGMAEVTNSLQRLFNKKRFMAGGDV